MLNMSSDKAELSGTLAYQSCWGRGSSCLLWVSWDIWERNECSQLSTILSVLTELADLHSWPHHTWDEGQQHGWFPCCPCPWMCPMNLGCLGSSYCSLSQVGFASAKELCCKKLTCQQQFVNASQWEQDWGWLTSHGGSDFDFDFEIIIPTAF